MGFDSQSSKRLTHLSPVEFTSGDVYHISRAKGQNPRRKADGMAMAQSLPRSPVSGLRSPILPPPSPNHCQSPYLHSSTLLAFRKSVENVHFCLNTMDFAAQPSGANVGAGTRWAIFVSF